MLSHRGPRFEGGQQLPRVQGDREALCYHSSSASEHRLQVRSQSLKREPALIVTGWFAFAVVVLCPGGRPKGLCLGLLALAVLLAQAHEAAIAHPDSLNVPEPQQRHP